MVRTDGPLVVFENGRKNSAFLYGYAREDWFMFFEDMGYATFDLVGHPFSSQDWDTENCIPWYFIATPKGGEDEAFIRNVLGSRIAAVHAYAEVASLTAKLESLRYGYSSRAETINQAGLDRWTAGQSEIDQSRNSAVALSAARDQIAPELSAVYNSRSWRITAPLCYTMSRFGKLKHRLGLV